MHGPQNPSGGSRPSSNGSQQPGHVGAGGGGGGADLGCAVSLDDAGGGISRKKKKWAGLISFFSIHVMGIKKLFENLDRHVKVPILSELPPEVMIMISDKMTGLYTIGTNEYCTGEEIHDEIIGPVYRFLRNLPRQYYLIMDKSRYVPTRKTPLQKKRFAAYEASAKKPDKAVNYKNEDGEFSTQYDPKSVFFDAGIIDGSNSKVAPVFFPKFLRSPQAVKQQLAKFVKNKLTQERRGAVRSKGDVSGPFPPKGLLVFDAQIDSLLLPSASD